MRSRFITILQISKARIIKVFPVGKDLGICFVGGPKPLSKTYLQPLVIKNSGEAEALLATINATDLQLASSISSNTSLTFDKKKLFKRLVSRELLAYKVSVYNNAPPKPAEEFLPVAGSRYKPVSTSPDSAPKIAKNDSKKAEEIVVKQTSPETLDDCEQRIKAARKKLDEEGYKPKYSDAEQLAKVESSSVSKERFLVSFQTKNTDPDAKLAFQRESELAPIWATSFDQLEYADSDPKLIADVLATPFDPGKDYVLHIIDRGEDLNSFGQNTLVPTWDNMQEPVQKYLGEKHDPKILAEL